MVGKGKTVGGVGKKQRRQRESAKKMMWRGDGGCGVAVIRAQASAEAAGVVEPRDIVAFRAARESVALFPFAGCTARRGGR